MTSDRGALAVLGLSAAEQDVYDWLVGRPPATLPELPQPGVVAALEARGLVTELAGPPARYAAVAPDVALEVLLLQREQRMREAHRYVDELTARYRAHTAAPTPQVIELVAGQREIARRVTQLRQAARHELRSLEKAPWTGVPPGDRVTSRTVYENGVIEAGSVEELSRPGHVSRVLPVLPVRLHLVDDRLALLQQSPASAMIVHPCALFDALAALFEGLWSRALPVRPPSSPADHQRDLVALLLSGVPDQTIARELGVGYRTVQRQIATLMRDLGASTRFQAGAQVALREQRVAADDPV